jgi:hypothetical protein
VVLGILKHIGLDAGNFFGNAIRAADDGSQCEYDVVEACCCIVAVFEVSEA